MRYLLIPSLHRRIALTLLLSFCLVAIVLAARDYAISTDPEQIDQIVANFGGGVMEQLDVIEKPDEARGAVEALEFQVNRGYREAGVTSALALQLWDRAGVPVYLSKQPVPQLPMDFSGTGRVNLRNRTFHVFSARDARWRIVIAQPAVPRAWLLQSIVSDLGASMLIAFPFILAPLWLAVSQGLRPLTQLAQQISARDSNDLTATAMRTRHAELRPLVSSLDRLLMQLRDKVAREQAFVQDAAHEMRTPMAVISAQAHALARARDEQECSTARDRLNDAIARSSNLVEQLLQLARFDSHAGVPMFVDIAQLVQEELGMLEPLAFAKQIDLSLEAPDELVWPIELAAFRAVLQNLVANAIHYVRPCGRVMVELSVKDEKLHLSVTDDGPGIIAPLRDTVFERFVRGRDHEITGSGLGLAIVRQAAARLQGKVQLVNGMLNSAGDFGCRFEIVLTRSVLAGQFPQSE